MKKTISLILSVCLTLQLMCVLGFGSVSASAEDITSNFNLSYLCCGEWKSFENVVIAKAPIEGLRISGEKDGNYFEYRVSTANTDSFLPFVTSKENDFAGIEEQPIHLVQIFSCNSNGERIDTGLVGMYRVHIKRGRWYRWLSTANDAMAHKIIDTYGLSDFLDNSGDGFAGYFQDEIDGIEFRVFNETSEQVEQKDPGYTKMIDAPYINQNPAFPTGCESVSTVMALQYNNIDISADKFVDEYLEKGPTDNFLPDEVFGGDPRTNWSYGCYSPVIKRALDKALVGTGYHAREMHGKSISYLKHKYLDNDIPVIFWATMGMKPTYFTGQTCPGVNYNWIASEHCLLLVGYDNNSYYFNDPLDSKQTKYSKYAVENAYTGMLEQAVVIEKDIPDDQAIVYGDVDGDTFVDSCDVLITLKNSVGSLELTDAQKLVVDVDDDLNVTVSDALLMLQRVVLISDSFPVIDNYNTTFSIRPVQVEDPVEE